VRQAEQLVYTASEEFPTSNAASSSRKISSALFLEIIPAPLFVPPPDRTAPFPRNFPPAFLRRFLSGARIRQAEQQLVAFNANRRSSPAYYPQISLTVQAACKATAHPSLQWPLRPLEFLRFPVAAIFTAGRISFRRQIRRKRASRKLFSSISKRSSNPFATFPIPPIAYKKNANSASSRNCSPLPPEDASRLSNIRYKGGVTSYLEVLTNETNYFSAQLISASTSQ